MKFLDLFLTISFISLAESFLFRHTQPPPTTVSYLPGCPIKHTYPNQRFVYHNKCYEFILRRSVDWTHAQHDCRSKGGHLVTIENAAEETLIMQYLSEVKYHNTGVWIGLHDREQEGKFVWDSGKPVNFTHWDKGQPDDSHVSEQQDCVLLYVPESRDHHTYQDGTPGWHDQRCSDGGFLGLTREDDGFVCEYATHFTTTSTQKTTDSSNPTTPEHSESSATLPVSNPSSTAGHSQTIATTTIFVIG